ncbi:MAG: AraC family transcriptional regulator [Oscillospiraceae bacterium]|nr:AraC family transcriptional regulator [Oscillospiraceae bacterium]
MDEIYLCYCGIEECRPGQFFDAAGRDAWHLHVIVSGKGSLLLEDEEIQLHFGQMFITKPGERCLYYADAEDPWVYCWMTFDGDKAASYVASAGFGAGVNHQDCYVDANNFYRLVSRILEEPEMSLANDLMSQGLLMEYLALSIRSNYRSQNVARHTNEYTAEDYVTRAMSMIDGNFATIKIADVARNIGLNRSYLTTLFKQRLGISPQEYLVQCRMKWGCYYLEHMDNRIQEIAQYVGYGDSMTFSKLFKKIYNMTPTEYRSKKRANS